MTTLTTQKLCECGCGQETPLAPKNHTANGYVKGQAIRFIKGHNNRLRVAAANPRWKVYDEQVTIGRIHDWLRATHPKSGVCDECARSVTPTHYAFLHHGERRHTRNRADYRELCASCHMNFDRHLIERGRARARAA